VSFDGSHLAVPTNDGWSLVPLDGRPPRHIDGMPAGARILALLPDNKALLGDLQGVVSTFDLGTRAVHTVRTLAPGADGMREKAGGAVIARGGKAYVYGLQETSCELWLAAGLR
jgi:hypothetical protein